MKPNRFFIVFWKTAVVDGKNTEGSSNVTTRDTYVNLSNFTKQVSEMMDDSIVIVTNIIELNKSDYNDWIRKD